MLHKGDYTNYKDETVATPRNDAVWAGVLDKRYAIEIHHVDPYKGLFIIFDIQNNFKPVYFCFTTISFDATFGPDIADITRWQHDAISIIDKLI